MASEIDVEGATQIAAFLAAADVGVINKPNATFFKYVSLSNETAWRLVEETLLQNRLKLSGPNNMNDPFDVKPVIVDDLSDEDRLDVGRWFFQRFAGTDITSFRVMNESNVRELSSLELGNEVVKSAEIVHRQSMERDRITCFSRRINSILMWGHYADSHRGIAYQFSNLTNEGPFVHLRPVKYSTQRPIVYLSEITARMREETRFELARTWYPYSERAYLTKSLEWAYEEEQRIIAHSDHMDFGERELVGIIVGARFSNEDYKRLTEIAARRARKIRIWRATLSRSTYSIEVDWLST